MIPVVKSSLREHPAGSLLKSVSRSFYLSVKYLPSPMSKAVAVAYLLARATDTVADAEQTPGREREALLQSMGSAIAGRLIREESATLSARLRTELAEELTNRGERELLVRFDECLSALDGLPGEERELVRCVLETIVRGQLWDLTYFREHVSVEDAEQTRRYTYLVAGCVGEFWTLLGLRTMGAGFSRTPEEKLLKLGIRYGQGLQLVNIVRDYGEDAARGRCYLPGVGVERAWLQMAGEYVRDGLLYAEHLRNWRVRFASALPARLALRTLQLIQQQKEKNLLPGSGKAKITRGCVYREMLRCLAWALWGPRKG